MSLYDRGRGQRSNERYEPLCFQCRQPGHIARDWPSENVRHPNQRAQATYNNGFQGINARFGNGRYRHRSPDDLRMHTLRSTQRRTDAAGPSSRGNTERRPPQRSEQQSRRRSRSPVRDYHGGSGRDRREVSDISMGGMTNSQATKRNRQTNGQNVHCSSPQANIPLERRPYYQGMQNQFADPYIASPDTPEGRDNLRRAEYKPVPDNSTEADARRVITPMLEMVASRDLTPAEIPGEFFMTVSAEEQLRICRNLSISLSHSAAGVYRHVYGNFDKARNTRNNKGTALGTIGFGPITEVLYDFGVGVHDTDRANSTHGPTIGDRRPLILLDKGSHGMLRVASITSFGGSDGNGRGAPPPERENEYALLIDELASDPPGVSRKHVVRYSGSAMKPNGSWVRLGRYHELPYWTPIEWNMGRISIDAHDVLADAFNFAADHAFRAQGMNRRQRKATELEEVGGDAATREERGKRQEREMNQIREREQMQKSARKVPGDHQDEETGPTPQESNVREGLVGDEDPVTDRAQDQ